MQIYVQEKSGPKPKNTQVHVWILNKNLYHMVMEFDARMGERYNYFHKNEKGLDHINSKSVWQKA